jgi:hypothetical protein
MPPWLDRLAAVAAMPWNKHERSSPTVVRNTPPSTGDSLIQARLRHPGFPIDEGKEPCRGRGMRTHARGPP